MFQSRGHRITLVPPVYLNVVELNRVSRFKYLGHWVSENLMDKRTLRESAGKTINALRIQYNNAFRVLLGLPRYCSASGMFEAVHTDGFHAVLTKESCLVAKLYAWQLK
ncbi:uncharacterized protein LOC113229336 [Hyposmocoma kahamanoa]|uniref:uncharacterized protein LOC113229336 n=1 Tax=Hyposmocoma kahamanoa TaxID=1477025 RepID=UPI000E6D7E2A|nr:uncharacterized protein LOC113229336 [Hyposmocoma kahamanoa]